ncbi:hypothetical protein P3749_25610, partial [Vibrio parahaemolyticus]|nr:hypothetical protein [Vibrio parahaemolyticus]NMS23949.1 cell division protein FtsZ [Vibrio parahaemolyticus]
PLGEIEDAIGMIEAEADEQADIIWGSVIREDLMDEIKVTVIATGFDSAAQAAYPRTSGFEAKPAAVNAGLPMSSGDSLRGDDLDVPTFIRRQAD